MRGQWRDAADPGFVDVEIVDASEPLTDDERRQQTDAADRGAGAGPDDGADDDRWSGRRRSRLGRAGWVVVGVVLLVVGVNVVEGLRAAAEADRLAELPGVVGSLAEPVEEIWRVEASSPIGRDGDVMVVQPMVGNGITAIDLRTGGEVWRHALPQQVAGSTYCQPWDMDPTWFRSVSAEVTSILCVTDRQNTVTTSVELIATATGEVRAALDLEEWPTYVGPVDGDLVASWVDDRRRPVATRIALADGGEELWRFTGEPLPEGADPGSLSGFAHGDVLLVSRYVQDEDEVTSEAVVELDLRDGTPVPVGEQSGDGTWSEEYELASGHVLHLDQDLATGDVLLRVVRADGRELLATRGWPWLAPVDDGSAPDVLVVADGSGAVRGMDLGTGETLWTSSELAEGEPVLRLDGVVVLVSNRALAVDVRTGEVLWEVPDVAYGGGLTDGRRVLLLRASVEGPGEVSVHDLVDGAESWRTQVPGAQYVMSAGGTALVQVDDGLVALGRR